MLDVAKRILLSTPPVDEISTGGLLSELAANPRAKLIFSYEGRDVLPGYHVTEVKDGRFEALDCGANPEAWRETFIQLWDVPGDDASAHMPVSKFAAILRKVSDVLPFDANAKLTFEVSDGVGAIQLFRAESIAIDRDTVRVALSRRPASCKPRDRWLEQQPESAGCRSPAKSPCCG